MPPNVKLWFPKRLNVALQPPAQTADTWVGAWIWSISIWLMVIAGSWQVGAETAPPAFSHPPQPAAVSLRRGTVTLPANLRASPSMLSEIVGFAKEKMRVKILQETGRWYQISGEDGGEAWIYKPLVLIDQESIPRPSGTADEVGSSDLMDNVYAEAPALEVVGEFQV